ncbi:lysylphosphatidylglycerol synthase transmembrane domain-containing protein [Methanosarcina sp. Mfa9]|uniref:lysylphosphatidylglycerol synthase transmembrane domain-containing protein n=1 Tax=Methanosarcina sp. Mfa9 TaxID=3439063 RepID=UPI003F82FFF9
MGAEKQNSHSLAFPPPLILRAGRYLPTLIFLGFAVNLILPELASVEESLQVIKTMVLWAVLLAALAQVIRYMGSGYLLHSIVANVNQKLSVSRGALITIAAASVGLLAGGPLGNGAAIYRWVRKLGISAEASGLAGTLPTFFNNTILVILGVAGILELLAAEELSSAQFSAFLLILVGLGLGIASVGWGKQHRKGFMAAAVREAAFFSRALHRPYNPHSTETAVLRMFAAFDVLEKGGWKRPALGAVLTIGFDMLTLYFFFIAAGNQVSPSVLLVGYGLPLLFGRLAFLLPGGVGIVESTMAALYTGLGVPGPIAVVVILGYRMFSFWIPTFLGFPLAAYLQKE